MRGGLPMKLVRALIIASHPIPSLAVTAMATLLTAEAAPPGFGAGRVVLVALAVLAGQLSVGWSNDAIDADRDAGRAGKAGPRGPVRRPDQRARPLAGGRSRRGGIAGAGGRARPGQPGDRRGDDGGRVVVQPRAEVDGLVGRHLRGRVRAAAVVLGVGAARASAGALAGHHRGGPARARRALRERAARPGRG